MPVERPLLDAPHPPPATSLPTPAQALWNHREWLAARREHFRALSSAVASSNELALYQWAQLSAFALEFQPSLIVELGRGRGNSTCCFLEVSNGLGGRSHCRLLSLCLRDDWMLFTVPRLKSRVPPDWFAPADVIQGDILGFDFGPAVEAADRVFVFWDAHGFDVAECVLGRLLPLLAKKPHIIVMHDLSDLRFEGALPPYGDLGLWKGSNAAEPSVCLGHIFSRVAQSISVVDFTTRNRIPLHSAAESFHQELGGDPAKREALRASLTDELFSLHAHWFWFSLNQAPAQINFPHLASPEARFDGGEPERQLTHARRLIRQVDHTITSLHLSSARLDPAALQQLGDFVAQLQDSLICQEQELATLRKARREQDDLLNMIQASVGWRLLNRWRALRERLAPPGTRRDSFYQSVVKRLLH